jgi:hypothetical protein
MAKNLQKFWKSGVSYFNISQADFFLVTFRGENGTSAKLTVQIDASAFRNSCIYHEINNFRYILVDLMMLDRVERNQGRSLEGLTH